MGGATDGTTTHGWDFFDSPDNVTPKKVTQESGCSSTQRSETERVILKKIVFVKILLLVRYTRNNNFVILLEIIALAL